MERYSSNLTLFYVIFLPVFAWVFLLASTLASFLGPVMSDEVYISDYVKYGVLTLLVLMTLFIIFFAFRLKRLEADEEKIYISNYFVTTMMPVLNIEKVVITDLLVMRIATIHLINKSRWGKHIKVLERENMFQTFCETHHIRVDKTFSKKTSNISE